MIKWIKKFIRVINLFLIGLTLISYFSPSFNPQVLWFAPFFSYALPIFLGLNFAMMLFLYSIKHKSYWLNILTLALSFFFLGDLVNIGSSDHSSEKLATEEIKVMSFNVLKFQKYTKYRDGENQFERGFELYSDLFETQKPTIVAFQEGLNGYFNKRKYLENYFKDELGLGHYYTGNSSVITFSKYPIINKGIIIEAPTNASTFVDIKIDTSIIRVYNVHLQSTGIAPDAEKVIKNPDMEDDATKQNVKNIIVRLKRSNDKRTRQVKIIKEHMDNCPYPIILCGDFNDNPFSYTYRQLSEKLQDSFKEKGDGVGETYNGRIPLLRIDYILASPRFKINSHEVIHKNISDHYPVVSKMQLR